jgi:3-oxoacyl-[acyl-carrier-protein] synthase III
MTRFNYIDYYLSREKLSIDDLLDRVDESSIPGMFSGKDEYEMFAKSILKLDSIIIESKLTMADMMENLIEKMFAQQVVKPEDIGIIILAQEKMDDSKTNFGHYLQYKYKMNRAHVLNISGNHCVNVEMAVSTAYSIMNTNTDIKNILIVSATRTGNINKRLLGSFGIYGDAAGLILLGKNDRGIRFLDNEVLCFGEMYDANMEKDNSITLCRLYLKCIKELIDKRSVTNETLGTIVIQNANPLLATQCIASAGLDKKKIFEKNLSKYGHLNQIDFIVNLKDAIDEPSIDKKKNILTFGSGWAGTYVSSLFSF